MTDVTFSEWLVLAALIAVCLLPAAAIGRWTSKSIQEWYPGLRKPSWNPPSWLFAPVWSVLYLSMAVACWLVWRSGPETPLPLGLFALQLCLNHGWSPLFFLAKRPKLAFLELCLTWLAAAATTGAFFTVHALAGQLMLPYMAWLTFAALLNYRIWRLNSDIL